MMLSSFSRSQAILTAIATFSCVFNFMMPVTAQEILPQEAETNLYEQAETDLPENFYILYRIVERIARANNLDEHPWRVTIVDDNDIGAYATQANLILISFGLLDQMAGDASALACVVAHEMAHHVHQHTAIFTSQLAEWKEEYQDENQKFEQQAVELRHHQELEADAIGYRYAVTAGFEASGCFRGFNILSRLPETLRDSATHPAVPNRIESLETFLQKYPPEALGARGQLALKTSDPLTYELLEENQWLRINSVRGGSFTEDLERLFPE